MFEPEKMTDSTIHIKEFDAATIRKMIRFMYADNLEEKESEVDMDLLAIAHKYDVKPLQTFCEKKLCQEIRVENVLDAWMGASLLGSQHLMRSCERFASANWSNVKNTETFPRLK